MKNENEEGLAANARSFGAWVRHRRKMLDLTQEQLAQRVSCARVTIKKIEGDELVPSKSLASLLGVQLNVPVDELDAFIKFARGTQHAQSEISTKEVTPPWRAAVQTSPPLPVYLTRFIGRENEIIQVTRLLAAHHLVTLTGSGGVGKTRLAMQIAANELDARAFRNGVWLGELAALADADQLTHAVATTFGLLQQPATPLLTTLTDFLRERNLLLVLDNCEHLIHACAELTDHLLRVCPGLYILATSREALNLAGEIVFRVPALTLPPDDQHRAALDEYEATRLFLERAQNALATFQLTNENAPSVIRICQRLDGLALAIELAAARVKMLSVQEIASRLDDRFRLLTDGARTALPRHQTLRATMDWSYALLTPAERVLLQRLSVFVGGWSLQAAEQVCKDEGKEMKAESFHPSSFILSPSDVLDLLTRLVDKSLVLVEEHEGTTRYRLLETIREYARDKLRAAGEFEPSRDRHLQFFLRFAEEAEPELSRANQLVWFERIEAEHDNVRAALQWALERGQIEQGLCLAIALTVFWNAHTYWSEGRKWLETLLAQGHDVDDSVRTKGLYCAGFLARSQGDCVAARSFLEASLETARDRGDKRGIARSQNQLGIIALQDGEDERGRLLFESSLALSREFDDKRSIAFSLDMLANAVRNQGAYARADALYAESLAMLREMGNLRQIAYLLNSRGVMASRQGDFALRRSLAEQALAIWRELKDKHGIAATLSGLAWDAYVEGDYVQANRQARESLVLMEEIGSRDGVANCLVNLATFALEDCGPDAQRAMKTSPVHHSDDDSVRRARLVRGVRLFSAAETLRDMMWNLSRNIMDRHVAWLKEELAAETFSAAWQEGQTMTVQQAIAYALE